MLEGDAAFQHLALVSDRVDVTDPSGKGSRR